MKHTIADGAGVEPAVVYCGLFQPSEPIRALRALLR